MHALFFEYAWAQSNSCAAAGALVVGAAPLAGTTAGSTAAEGGETPLCGTLIDQSVWYKFQATATTHTVNVIQTAGGCFLGSSVRSGACIGTMVTCENINFGPSDQHHSLSGLTIGNWYLIQIGYDAGGFCGASASFTVDVDAGTYANTGTCLCADDGIFSLGTCHSRNLNGAINCLGTQGCMTGANPTSTFIVKPTATPLWITIDNRGTSYTGNVEVLITSANDCASQTVVSTTCLPLTCPADVISFSQAITVGTRYGIYISSGAGSVGANTDFGICFGDGAACGVAACGVAPGIAGNAYGIYSPDAINSPADVVSSEIYASALCGANGFKVAEPANDATFTQIAVTTYPVITAENISCLNSDIDFTTTDATPVWPVGALGTNATIADPADAATVSNNQYFTALGRRTINFEGDIVYPSQTFTASPNVAIPDNGCGTPALRITSNIVVAGYVGTVATTNITVTVNITHTFDADLDMFLTASNGQILMLSTDNGGGGDNYTNTVFGTAGATNITAGAAPFTGTFRPEGALVLACGKTGTVATFTAIGGGALNPNGTWSLQVSDDLAALTGTLLNWSITFPSYTVANQPVTYNDFVNIQMDKPAPGTVTGTTPLCPGTSNYASNLAGTPGYTYLWSCTPPAGGTIVFTASTASSTNITYTNSTAGNLVFPVKLDITSGCCGPLTQITYNVTVYPDPSPPGVLSATISECIGGDTTLQVSPATAGYSYKWYNAASAGTLLGNGSDYVVTPILTGTTSYWAEAIDANACISPTRTEVQITGTNYTLTATSPSSCAAGNQTITITNPVAGSTYTWYDDVGLTPPANQSSVSLSYIINLAGPAPQTGNMWVNITRPGGCSASTALITTATLTTSPASVAWDGSTSTDWFDATNWTPACVPTSNTDVTIANAAVNNCSINFDAVGGGIAYCKSLTIESARIVTLVETKTILEIYGDFTNNNAAGFVANTRQVKFKGSVAQAIGGTASTAFYTLTIENLSTGVTVNTNTTVTGYLNLNSGHLIVPAAGRLTLGSAAVITPQTSFKAGSTASFVSGFIDRSITPATSTTEYSFPMGIAATGLWRPLSIIPGDVSARTWTIEMVNGNPTSVPYNAIIAGSQLLTSLSSVYYYKITVTGGAYSSDLKLWYEDADLGFAEQELLIGHWNTVASNWDNWSKNTAASWAGNSTTNWVQVKAVSSFSPVARGRSSAPFPLPIEMLSFNAVPVNEQVYLSWITLSEKNNDYFTIERSKDTKNFEEITRVKAVGNSTEQRSYSSIDGNPYKGVSYYRLKQTDIDGDYRYSQIVAVEFSDKPGRLNIYPNPARTALNVYYDSSSENPRIAIYDVQDKLVKQYLPLNSTSSKQPFSIFSVDISNLANGMYFITSTTSSEVRREKFVKE